MIIEIKGKLKEKYKIKQWLWKYLFKRFCVWIAEALWSNAPFLIFLLIANIQFGTMKYYYFKYGLGYVLKRIRSYNKILSNQIEDKDTEIDSKEFYMSILITGEDDINIQLNREIRKFL